MNGIVLTKAHQFWPLIDYLSGFGVPIGRYIEMFRLPGKMLEAPELYIDESRFWRLAGSVAVHEGFLDWGFRAGQDLDFSAFGEFGTTLLQQPSLKVALEVFVETASAESLQTQFGLSRQGENYWFFLSGYRDAPAGRSIVEFYDLQLMSSLVRRAVGKEWLPSSVHLQCTSLPEGIAAKEISTDDIRFSSTMTAIAIPEAMMAMPMCQYRSSAHSKYEAGISSLDQTDFATSLRLLLTGYLDECLTIGVCADLIGMSNRTLQRRLAENGTSFNQLLDQTRFDLAKQLLQDESIKVTEICYELGYANPANFTRAFQRWAGVSPRQHRYLHCQP